MKTIRATATSRNRRAFTLVEMLIVAALIALFSAMAVFGVQQQFRSNQRKATIGETRQMAAALDFAYNDVGIFPKIAFLQESTVTLEVESQRQYSNPTSVYNIMQSFGVPTGGIATKVQSAWRGPYFSASQSRSRVSQGRGGSRIMKVTGADATGWPWPVDVWNNPYMLYNMHMDRTNPASPTLYFVVNQETDPNAQNLSPNITGNFINAVVSYGPNQVPGGGEAYVSPGDPASPNPGEPFFLRLYTGNPEDTNVALQLFTGIGGLGGANGRLRANAWSLEFYQNNGGAATDLARSDDNQRAVGITDKDSDDVVFTF